MYHITALLWLFLIWPFQGKRVFGKHNIPKDRPYLVIANHPGTFDPWTVVSGGTFFSQPIHWLAQAELFSIRSAGEKFVKGLPSPLVFLVGLVVSFVVKHSRTIPVVQGGKEERFFSSSNKEMMRSVQKVWEAGGVVGAFPNGTRGEEQEFYASFVRMAKNYATTHKKPLAILPVTISAHDIIFHDPVLVHAHFDRNACASLACNTMMKIQRNNRGRILFPSVIDRLAYWLYPVDIVAFLF